MAGSDVEEALLLIKNKNTSQYMELRVRPWLGNLGDEQPTVVVDGVRMEGERGVPIEFSCDTACADLLSRAVKRFEQVVQYRDAAMVPARPFEFGHWRCDWCPFSGTCWEGYEDESSELVGDEAALLVGEHADLATKAREIYETNERRKTAEARVKEMKSEMKVELMKRDLRVGLINLSETHELTVKLRMQSREGIDASKIPSEVLPLVRKISTFEVLDVKARKKKQPKKTKKPKVKKKAAKKKAAKKR